MTLKRRVHFEDALPEISGNSRAWRLAAMRKVFRASLTLLVLSALCGTNAGTVFAGARHLATITGSVRDNHGNPLAGAVVAMLREGAEDAIKETRSAEDGTFNARVTPGRYSLRAVADGFGAALFSSVDVGPSAQLIYRFNLEPVGNGNTAPERRRDRDDRKWILRGLQGRRSIFQENEGEDATVNAVLDATEEKTEAESADATLSTNVADIAEKQAAEGRTQVVIENYVAASTNQLASSYAGMNFAVAKPLNRNIDFIFAGQIGAGLGAPQRFQASARVRANDSHRVGLSVSGAQLSAATIADAASRDALGQFSVRAIDEWIVRDGVVVVFGLDYSRFLGASNAHSVTPRLGLQFDANARTRVRAAYAAGDDGTNVQSVANFEDQQVVFKQNAAQPIALVDGRAVMEKSRRFELGVERVLDNQSSIEATAFFDTTSGRGVGLLSTPLNAFASEGGAALLSVANQEGAARGLRVVYSRRMNKVLSAAAGYSFGQGQHLSTRGLTTPSRLFDNGFFQTAAVQVGADMPSGTHVRTVFRFSPKATVFAIDPFAGRLAVFDPSLSIMVTQDLPTFGLPVHAEAVVDARNLFDTQTSADDGETLMSIFTSRRSVRGGILVRF
jgi:hypothetical protein